MPRACDRFCSVVRAELRVDVVEVFVDRSGCDVEEGGDLPVLLSLRDEGEHLSFAGRQAVLGGGKALRGVAGKLGEVRSNAK